MCVVLLTGSVLHKSCKRMSIKRGVKAAAFAELTDLRLGSKQTLAIEAPIYMCVYIYMLICWNTTQTSEDIHGLLSESIFLGWIHSEQAHGSW